MNHRKTTIIAKLLPVLQGVTKGNERYEHASKTHGNLQYPGRAHIYTRFGIAFLGPSRKLINSHIEKVILNQSRLAAYSDTQTRAA